MIKKTLLLLATTCITVTYSNGISVNDISTFTDSINVLANTLKGNGVSISNVSFYGNTIQAGTYTGSVVESQGNTSMVDGIILSSGDVNYLNSNRNTTDEASVYNLTACEDEDLLNLAGSPFLYDASILEFDLTADYTGIASFTYVFGSDEYDEWVGEFNDVLGFFVDGINVATIPETQTPISVNTINKDAYSQYFIHNDPSELSIDQLLATEMDGFSIPLIAQFDVEANKSYHMKLAIADQRDLQFDSWVLFGANSFNITPMQSVPEPNGLFLLGIGSILLVAVLRKKKLID